MTSNQIAAIAAKETERSNRVKERETHRSNRAKEGLTRQANTIAGAKAAGDLILGAGKLVGGANDPSWYNLDKQMVKDAASISFSTPLGYETNPTTRVIAMDGNLPDTNFYEEVKQSVPGVMVLNYVPMLGNTEIITNAGLNIYAYIRHANSGSRNYEYQDLMKYLFAIDSVYIGIAELSRIYSILNTYKAYNRFYSEAYLKALLGSDFDINSVNIADLRYQINNLINKVNALYVPNVMSLYKRHFWMSSGIFKDNNIKRSQNYMFAAEYVYKYDENVDNTSFGQLVPVKIKDSNLDSYIANVNGLLLSLLKSEDIGIMSGDILKAYGNSDMFMLSQIPEDYHIEELYSSEVLSQINAATVLGTVVEESLLIYEDPQTHEIKQGYHPTLLHKGNLNSKYLPMIRSWLNVPAGQKLKYPAHDRAVINMYKDEVTPDDVMVASRLCTITYGQLLNIDGGDNEFVQLIRNCGSEIIIDAIMMTFNTDPSNVENPLIIQKKIYDGYSVSTDKFQEWASMISSFDWAPQFRGLLIADTLNNSAVIQFNKDLANFAILSGETTARLHNVAMNSELGVPLLGSKVRR